MCGCENVVFPFGCCRRSGAHMQAKVTDGDSVRMYFTRGCITSDEYSVRETWNMGSIIIMMIMIAEAGVVRAGGWAFVGYGGS